MFHLWITILLPQSSREISQEEIFWMMFEAAYNSIPIISCCFLDIVTVLLVLQVPYLGLLASVSLSENSCPGCIDICLNEFWYYFKQLFSITRWCVMHITRPTLKLKVTVLAQTLSVRNIVSCLYLPHALIDFDFT